MEGQQLLLVSSHGEIGRELVIQYSQSETTRC